MILRSGLSTAEVMTNGAGEAIFSEITAGSYTLRLAPPTRPELTSTRKIRLRAEESKRITVHVGDFHRSISGRVLDRLGTPVPDFPVEARRHLFQPEDGAVVPMDQSSQRDLTDPEGFFEISGLDDAEYEVRTLPTERYAPARTMVRAGTESVQLILSEVQELRVHGRVHSPDGDPLPGVVVTSPGQVTRQTRSGDTGSYSVELALDGRSRFYTLKFELAGFRTSNWRLAGSEAESTSEHRLDMQMEPVRVTTQLTGRVVSSIGAAMGGEKLVLSSPFSRSHYHTVSHPDGRFVFREVEIGEDYRLSILPAGDYKDYTEAELVVPEEGLEHEIVLEPLASGRVRGFMVDVLGNRVTNVNLWVRSSMARRKSLRVVGGHTGYFEVDRVPAGDLIFETRSAPRFTLRRVQFPDNADDEIRMVLDLGDSEIAGIVTNLEELPLAGSEVALSWTHRADGIQSSSYRHTLADDTGRFVFTQVGQGPHKLRISSRGYASKEVSWDVGSGVPETVVIRLSTASSGRSCVSDGEDPLNRRLAEH